MHAGVWLGHLAGQLAPSATLRMKWAATCPVARPVYWTKLGWHPGTYTLQGSHATMHAGQALSMARVSVVETAPMPLQGDPMQAYRWQS